MTHITHPDAKRPHVHPAGDLDAELAQLKALELVAGAPGRGPQPTNSTNVCSGGMCCL